MNPTTQIEYGDGRYLISIDSDSVIREAVYTTAPDILMPEILESYLEYYYGSDSDF